jgi:hypothetical protein
MMVGTTTHAATFPDTVLNSVVQLCTNAGKTPEISQDRPMSDPRFWAGRCVPHVFLE